MLRAVALTASLLLPTLTLASCGNPTGPDGPPAEITSLPRALSVQETEALESANGFGLEMLRRLHARREEGDANVFISPLSASMALGMAMNGADGETFDGMSEALGLDGLSLEAANEAYSGLTDLLLDLDPSVQFQLANSAWLSSEFPIRADYRSRVEDAFDARIENVDFRDPGVADQINGWVEENTEDRITDLVTAGSIRELTALLVNAVYFEGSWTHQFDPAETETEDFRRPDGSTVSVPLMFRRMETDARFAVSAPDQGGYRAADLPYGGQAFSMTVVVPDGDKTLDELVAEVDEAWWQELVDGLQEGEFYINLPRFELTYEKLLNDVLVAMGMDAAFDPNRADFGRMVEGAEPGSFFIEWVRQKSFLSVDEEGTEAAAATGVGVGPTSAPPSVRADRPFLFAIRERLSGTILFIGTVTDPTAGA